MNNNVLWCLPGKRLNSFIYHAQDGYYYHFEDQLVSTMYFKCAISSCTGRAKLCVGSQLESTVPHNHPPNPYYPQVLALKHSIVEQAGLARYISFIDIVHQERSRIQNRHVRSMVTYRQTRSAMQRARNAVFPPIPASLQSLSDILQHPDWVGLTQSADLLDNLYRGSLHATDGSHAIIFISTRCLETLRQVSVIFVDCTFSISPSIPQCYQVLTIVSIDGHTVIPLCWVLMERKSESAYVGVLSYLRVLLGNWRFEKVVTDFEDGLINAFQVVFNITVQGCFFHSVNAMCTWARVNMTVTVLLNHQELLNIIALCCALPLLPQQYLQAGFRVICNASVNLGPLLHVMSIPFLAYVRHEWLEHINRGRTLSVSGSEHRTNNASESNNRRMNRQIGRPHPNIYHFLGKLVEFEDCTVDDMRSLAEGRTPSREQAVASLSNDIRIRSLTRVLLEDPNPNDEKLFSFLCSASFASRGLFFYALGIEADN